MDDDFTRNLSDPPSVALKRGQDVTGVRHWRVKCYDGNGPADIAAISVDGSDSFEIVIAEENDGPGAANLGSAELTAEQGHSSILAGSRISGDLTGALKLVADTDGNGGVLELKVEGDVPQTATIEAKYARRLIIGTPSDGIGAEGTLGGLLLLHGGLRSEDEIYLGTLATGALIDFDGADVNGILAIYDGGSGEVKGGDIIGDGSMNTGVNLGVYIENRTAEFTGRATFGAVQDAGITSYDLSGTLRFMGDFRGIMLVNYLSGSGRIEIDGSLEHFNFLPEVDDILIWDEFGPDAALTVDWNGWSAGDDWSPNASVQVGNHENAVFYFHQTPAGPHHLWETQPCVGDLDNNGSVHLFDVNGFVAATDYFNSGTMDVYDALYPGLAGSMIYHADINQDGTFNTFDVDPFIALLSQECRCDCPPAPGGGAGMMQSNGGGGGEGGGGQTERMPAEDAAALFATFVDPDLLGGFMTTVSDMTKRVAADVAAYWNDVLAHLE